MIKIVTTNLGSEFLYPVISQSLRERGILIELYDEHKKYSDDTIFAIGAEITDINAYQKFLTHRVIVEYQGESNSGRHGSYFDPTQKNILYIYGSCKNSDATNIIFYPNYFRHDLAIDYFNREYHHYRPKKTYSKKFLMPIRNWKGQAAWRREVFNQLLDIIPDAIYSMYEDGIYLPGSHLKSDRREINYSWFDDTFFSLTLESYYDHEKPIFPTEKIFKPIAFHHPFQVIASPKFLNYLKSIGFETFDNLFDESYDSTTDIYEKIKIIKKNVFEFNYLSYDKITEEKLQHNQNHFYNLDLVKNEMEKEFIDPVLNWILKN
jgi:hypothetical protein